MKVTVLDSTRTLPLPVSTFGRQKVYSGSLKSFLYSHSLSLLTCCSRELLHDWYYKTVSRHYAANDRVHEHCQIGEATQPRLETGKQLATFNHTRYQNSKKVVKGGLLLRRSKGGCLWDSAQRGPFDSNYDQVIKTIRDLTFEHGNDNVLQGGLADAHYTAGLICFGSMYIIYVGFVTFESLTCHSPSFHGGNVISQRLRFCVGR